MPEPTPPIPCDERAAVARLLEVVAKWCDDPMTSSGARVQYLVGYLHAIAADGAAMLRRGPSGGGVLDGLASSLDQWCAGLASGAIDPKGGQ
jgi:hypothetical protein